MLWNVLKGKGTLSGSASPGYSQNKVRINKLLYLFKGFNNFWRDERLFEEASIS
jgi:hypothetical protein